MSYEVLYIGQLRFVECLEHSLMMIDKDIDVSAYLHDAVLDTPVKSLGSHHSIDDIDISSAIHRAKSFYKFKNFKIVNVDVFWSLMQLYTLVRGIQNINSDLLIVLGTDTVFPNHDNCSYNEIIKDINHDVPIAFSNRIVDNEFYNVFTIFNKKAIDLIKKHGLEELRKFSVDSDDAWKTEFAWYCVLSNLGIQLQRISNIRCIRYRKNMGSISEIKNTDYSVYEQKFAEWREYKKCQG